MIRTALQRQTTWAEDTALQRCNRSAVPGVGVKAGPDHSRPGHITTSHQHQSEKPVWHDATRPTAGCHHSLANANHTKFQFTLSQDNTSIANCSPGMVAMYPDFAIGCDVLIDAIPFG